MGHRRIKRTLGGNFGRIFRFLSTKIKNNNNSDNNNRNRKRKIAVTSAEVLDGVLGGQSRQSRSHEWRKKVEEVISKEKKY